MRITPINNDSYKKANNPAFKELRIFKAKRLLHEIPTTIEQDGLILALIRKIAPSSDGLGYSGKNSSLTREDSTSFIELVERIFGRPVFERKPNSPDMPLENKELWWQYHREGAFASFCGADKEGMVVNWYPN